MSFGVTVGRPPIHRGESQDGEQIAERRAGIASGTNHLGHALQAWQEVLGSEHVLTDAVTLSTAEKLLRSRKRRVPCELPARGTATRWRTLRPGRSSG